MLNHVAVMLRGHVRTWHFTCNQVFNFYESIAKNVDYYFITYDNSNHRKIESTFKNKNLITLQIFPQEFNNFKFYDSWRGPAAMSEFLIPWLKRREQELVNKYDYRYDALFDTRPDVYPEQKKYLFGEKTGTFIPPLRPQPNCIYAPILELHAAANRETIDLAMQDWFMMMLPEVYEAMSKRAFMNLYEVHDAPGCQIEYIEVAREHGFNMCTMDWVNACMVRPSVFELSWWDSHDWSSIVKANEKWSDILTEEEKIILCERYGIEISDYKDSKSLTCKI